MKIRNSVLFLCMGVFLPMWAQNDYTAVIKTKNGTSHSISVADMKSIDFEDTSKVISEISYNWKSGGIKAATGEIYSRQDRIYSNMIYVREGDVVKTDGYLYVVVFYNNDGSWNRSDFTINGFRNRDYLVKESGYIRLLVANPDFSNFKSTECKVWVQHGGYERYVSMAEKYPELFPSGKFGLQAHRGFSDEFPENTVLSFEEAAKVPVYKGMETDAQMTSDGVLVCMHDDTIDRTTNGTGKVSSYTFAQLQEFFIDGGYGWKDEYANKLKVPTLESYLDICKKNNLVPYVELKLLTYPGIKKVVDMLHAKGFSDGQFILTSFTLNYLLYASTICDAPLEFMVSSFSDDDVAAHSHLKNIILRPSATKVTKAFVQKCHQYDVLAECYGITVGGEALVKNLIQCGVEGGTCNSWKNLGFELNK